MHSLRLEADIICGFFAMLIGGFRILRMRSTYSRFGKVLGIHIISSIAELTLYYTGHECSLIGVALCFAQVASSMWLTTDLKKGYPTHTKPAYQAGSVFRVIYMMAAYFKQSVAHYHDAVMPLHGFVYTRVLIFILCRMGLPRFVVDEGPGMENEATTPTVRPAPQGIDPPSQPRQTLASCPSAEQYRFSYAEAVLGASLISVGRCIDPSATMVYLVLYCIIGRLSQWTAENYATQRKTQRTGYRTRIVRILHWVGIDGSYNENARESKQGSGWIGDGRFRAINVPQLRNKGVE